MTMSKELSREEVEQSFTYRADLSDVNHLASEYFDWIATLIQQAKKELKGLDGHFGQVLNILHIAEHMADDKANEFLQQAKKFN